MPNNTSGGTTTSLNNTVQAKDDWFSAIEDSLLTFDVMANDLGGAAKILWSIDTTSDDGSTDLVARDAEFCPDYSEQGARIWIEAGMIKYDASALDWLAAGETVVDQFTYAIRLSNGTLSWATVNVTLTGTNDVAVIGGDVAGSVTEDIQLVTNGALTIVDADHDQSMFVAIAAGTAGTNGYGSFTVAADGTWSYALANGSDAVQALAAGETVTDSILVHSLDGSASQTIVVTITGTNDVPTITGADGAGTVVEDSAQTGATDDSNMASGTVAFTDVDLSDGHMASFAQASDETRLGTFALGDVSEAAGAAGGSLGWSYTIDEDAAQYLADGESVTEHYTVTVSDGHGGTVDQLVTVTITGTNDAPTITSADAAGTVVEDSAQTGTTDDSNMASGTVAFTDVDLSDGHTASFAQASDETRLGTFALGDISEAAGAAGGSLGWSYTIDEDAAQYLADGESVTEYYTVTVSDGHGGTVEQLVTVTITGTNDAPTVTGADAAGTVVEDSAQTGTTDDSNMASGTVAFTDVDLSDGHTASFAQASDETRLGTFALGDISEAAGAAGGSLGWSYTIDEDAAQYLADGESVTEHYTVTVSDGHGGTVEQMVTVTITGTNDDPTITSADVAGTVVEDSALTGTTDDSNMASGTVAFTDVDLSDGHTASFAQASDETRLGTFALGDISEAAGAAGGSLGWSYTIDEDAAQYLADGESVTEHYTVTVSDGHGGTVEQMVTVTITGTNDAPALTGTAASLGDGIEDTGYTVLASDLLAGWSDVEGDSLLVTGLSADHGSVHDNDDGTYTITPDANYNGPLVLNYGVFDGTDTTSASLSLNVAAINDAPALTGTAASLGDGIEDAGYTVLASDLLAGWSDVEGDSLSVTGLSADHGSVHDNGDGTYTITPDANYNGPLALSYGVFDGTDTTSASLSLDVAAVNDAAIISGTMSGSVTEDAVPNTVTGDLNSTDVDGTADAWTAVTTATASVNGYGSYTMDASGHWAFALNNSNATVDALNTGGVLSDSFTVTTADGTSQIVNVTINGHSDVVTVTLPSTFTGNGDQYDFDTLVGAGVADNSGSINGGNSTDDVITGGSAGQNIDGKGGNDTIFGGGGIDAITGNGGDDTLYGQFGDDTIAGNNGFDVVYGGSGNDTVTGGNDDDTIYGGSGTDTINGQGGDDHIVGGYGADTLTGGGDNDTFVYLGLNDTNDTITDFNTGDHLDFTALDANSGLVGNQDFAFGGTTATAHGIWFAQVGSDVLVYADTDGNAGTAEFAITLSNVSASSLHSADFLGLVP